MAKIIFACGGTGGHVYPAIALAQYLSSTAITFLVSTQRKDKEIVQSYGYQSIEIPSSNKNLLTLCRGCMRAWHFFKKSKPQLLVATGGYHTVPIIIAAKLLKIPIILLEQNVLPGRTNRYLAKIATHTCVSFPESRAYLSDAIVTGNPIRQTYQAEPLLTPLLATLSTHPTILIIGGSQGARGLNLFFHDQRERLLSSSYNLIHLTGQSFFKQHFDGQQPTFKDSGTGAVCIVLPYCEDMKTLYEAADLIIARAGATTIAELITFQKKAILVPYPYAKDNHQHYNAIAFTDRGNGMIIAENQLQAATILEQIQQLLTQPFKRQELKEDPLSILSKLMQSYY